MRKYTGLVAGRAAHAHHAKRGRRRPVFASVRAVAAVAVVASAALVGVVAVTTDAFANAATPTPAGVAGSVTINSNGSVTVSAQGTWSWPSPTSKSSVTFPCGSGPFPSGGSGGDHLAVGWGMIWNDPTDPGVTVQEGSISEGVGSTKAVNGNSIDETVHTYTIQVVGTTTKKSTVVTNVSSLSQVAVGVQVIGSGIPAHATIASVTSGANSFTLSAQATASHSNESLALFSSLGPPAESSYNNGPAVTSGAAVTATSTSGTTYTAAAPYDVCGTFNPSTKTATGRWGPEVHTYASPTKVPALICVNMYDVHGTIADKASDYLVSNSDNSIQWNSFTPAATKSTCFSPGKIGITPTVTTTPSVGSNGTVAVGSPVTDSALVQGVGTFKPTGNVKFTVCGPSASASTPCTATAATAAALGDPTTPTSSTADSATYTSNQFTPTTPGTYCFLGVYSGDTNYKAGSDSTPARECFTAKGIIPGFTTTLKTPSQTTVGNSWGDKATVTGNTTGGVPGGAVTFTLCKETTPGTPCAGTAVATVTPPTSTSSSADTATYTLPSTQTPTTVGTYCFGAAYAGKGNYAAVAAQTDTECFAVTAATPGFTTTVKTPAQSTVGNSWGDRATVVGNAAGGAPTGAVTFSFCKETTPGSACTGGTTVATVGAPTSTSADTATYTLPTAHAQKPTTVGTYCFNASYAGAGNYASVKAQSDNECFKVTAATSTTTTQQSTTTTGTGTVTIGSSGAVRDTVTVAGNATGGVPKGTVSFYLCGPTTANALCSTATGRPEGTKTLTAGKATSTGFMPTAVGTYCFSAVYNPTPNGNYAGSSDNVTGTVEKSECFTVGAATPGLTTTLSPPPSTAVGNSWGDMATVIGNATGGAPKGTVTFFLCKETSGPCSGGTMAGSTNTATTTGDTSTFTLPSAQTPTAVGTYCFTASYTKATGGNYTSVPSQSDTECFTVTPATPGFTTALKAPSSSGVGNSWGDKATVTGNSTGGVPGGAVTFTFCKETTPGAPCVGTAVATVTPTSTSATARTATYTLPSTETPTTVGTYCFGASYAGKGNYAAVAAQTDTECFAVTAATPGLTTSLKNPTSTAVGNSWGDRATVVGNSAGGAPTGTVTFSLCKETTPNSPCTGGTTVATLGAPTSTSGDTSSYTLPAADVQTPTTVGTYCFNASYAGKGNYSAVNVQSDDECFKVTAATSTTTTQQSTTATGTGTVTIGSSGAVTDTVTVTGNTTGGVPEGTVSFSLCGPTTANALCSTATGRPEGTKTLVAGKATSAGFMPTAVGTYCFSAVYSPTPNGNYAGSSDNVTGTIEESECFTVGAATPGLTTTLSPPLNTAVGNSWGDTATVLGNATAGAPEGTVTFSLCKETTPGTSCSGGAVVGTTKTATTAGDTSTFTLPSAQTPTAVGTYCFTASYTKATGGNYTSVPSQSDTECFTVTPATSVIDTQQSASPAGEGSVIIGATGTVTDTATVTGNAVGGVPQGSVSFYLCGPTSSPALCTSTARPEGTKTLDAAGQATSTTFTPTAVGTYCFAAVYNPTANGNYSGSSDNVTGAVTTDECFTATQPDFTVVKTDTPGDGAPVVPGQVIPYTVTIANTGNAAGQVTVGDPLPSDVSLTGTPSCAVSAGDVCTVTVSGSTLTTTVTLAAGDHATVTFTATVSPTDTTTVSNTATITSGVCTVDCSSTVTNPVPNISVTKSASPAGGTAVTPGSTITYTLTLHNAGTATGTETVHDSAPADTTLVAGSAACATSLPAGASCTVTSSTGTLGWTVTLPAGATTTVSFAVTVDPADTASIANAATFSGPGCTTTTCTTDPVTSPVVVLSVVKSSTPAPGSTVSPGTTVTYSLTLSNAGTAVASGITVTDAAPAGTTYVTGSAACGGAPGCTTAESGGTVTWTGIDVGPGTANAITITFQVKVDAADTNGQVLSNVGAFTNDGTPSCTTATCDTNTVTLIVLVHSTAASGGSTPPNTTTTSAPTTPVTPATSVTVPPRSTAAISGATTVHTGEPWAGSWWLELLGLALGLGLLSAGAVLRRRTRPAHR